MSAAGIPAYTDPNDCESVNADSAFRFRDEVKLHGNLNALEDPDEFYMAPEIRESLQTSEQRPFILSAANAFLAAASRVWLAKEGNGQGSNQWRSNNLKGQLPTELILKITSFIDDSQKAELYSSLNVNWRWNVASTMKYWKNIRIHDDNSWSEFNEVCLGSPLTRLQAFHPYSSYLQTLKISNLKRAISSNSCIALMQCCSNLEHLTFDDVCIEPLSVEQGPDNLKNLKSLSITYSPDLSMSTLIEFSRQTPNLKVLFLAGINNIDEPSVCTALSALPLLKELRLGDLRATRAAFSSTRGLALFEGELLAAAIAKWCANLTCLSLDGLIRLSPVGFTGLLMALQNDQETDGEETVVEVNNDEETTHSDHTCLTDLSLHTSAINVDDIVFQTTLSTPVAISHLTRFCVSEIHCLSDATFIQIMAAMGPFSLRHLEVGPGLNLSDIALNSVGQTAMNLKSFKCIGLQNVTDIGSLVGFRFIALETLVLKDMKSVKEVRPLVCGVRRKAGWSRMVELVMEEDQMHEKSLGQFEEAVGPPQVPDEIFADALETFPGINFAHQVNPATIMAEIAAAMFGIAVPLPDEVVEIGCQVIQELEIWNCSSLDGKTIVKLVSSMNQTLSSVSISRDLMDDANRVVK
ncbi:hypothetical protein BC830DRAFT_1219930 [Chytriomyces sp. MP71]|nr:hypothetical protein BC830DRAFT_1219930 [Chytriomyces sp. MP71]